ncbi:MAG TPA: bacteriohopanetetrol glucosamine biosynthesis glycosyltransferase HpnI [Micropepsaceae bacterium]|nr:bacteriohopanetetrol glucosamine biosynthesis glycosyltransferase HpnI [Micropepsaceae bacterium]
MLVFAAIGWLLVACALIGACYAVASARAVERFFNTPNPEEAGHPPVTVLKPLHGAERGLAENLAGFCAQDYPSAIQILFGVQDATDPAIAIVEALGKKHPHLDIMLIVGTYCEASNPKIANLVTMFPHAKHDILVLSDSDIGVPARYLRNIVAMLKEPGVGAVTCCYTGRASGRFWPQIAAMGIDYQFLPAVLYGVGIGLATPCFGSTIAVRKSVLAEIGGFAAFGERLADDYEIGRAIRARGYQIAMPPFVVTHSSNEDSAADLLRHELRWARTIRGIDALGHLGSVVTHPVPLAILGALLLGFSYPATLALAVAIASRLWLKHRIDRALGISGLSSWLLVPRDVLSFMVFLSSFFIRQVDWQGQRYKVVASGMLVRD